MKLRIFSILKVILKSIIFIVIFLLCLGLVYLTYGIVSRKRIAPSKWAIGIYKGDSPFRLSPSKDINNPVLTAEDVTDVRGYFVADPFMVKEGAEWHMFFEVFNADTNKGEIGSAVSKDGFHWEYKQIVLTESFHLSFPYVFKWKDEYYMIPESSAAHSIRLYKAESFPNKWKYIATLIKGGFSDSVIFHYNDTWWLITSNWRTMRLYYSHDILGPWVEHPSRPILTFYQRRHRSAGRILLINGRIIRFTQEDYPYYGRMIRAFEIVELSPKVFVEKEISQDSKLEPSGFGWNAKGMHTVDIHKLEEKEWIACVDGF